MKPAELSCIFTVGDVTMERSMMLRSMVQGIPGEPHGAVVFRCPNCTEDIEVWGYESEFEEGITGVPCESCGKSFTVQGRHKVRP